MKIRQDQLSNELKRGLANAYLVSGDDPLLVQEACDEIRAAARQAGIDEREVFHTEAGFSWHDLRDEANAMSLFASRRVLEVRINNGKPSDKGDTLKELIDNPNPDNILLIICPRLDASQSRSAWVKAVEQKGIFLPIWPIDRNQYPAWLNRRIQMAGLRFEPQALALLAQQTEGNLLAAVQEIEKLRLLGSNEISLEQLQNAIGDSSRYDAFGLADACLLGNTADAYRMLQHLHNEGIEAIMILGALLRKIHQLITLKPLSAAELNQAFKSQNIWDKQQPPFRKALSNLSLPQLYQALQMAAQIDHAIKSGSDNPWRLLHELVLLLSGSKLQQLSANPFN